VTVNSMSWIDHLSAQQYKWITCTSDSVQLRKAGQQGLI